MGTLNNLTKWQNYAHYLLLSGSIFFIHYLTDIWGIEQYAVNSMFIGWVALFLFYALGLFVFDTLIHLIFAILPRPYRWED